MYILLMFIHVLVCVFLIIVVLLQSGKAADLAGAFGRYGLSNGLWPARLCDVVVEGDDDLGGSLHAYVPVALDHGDAECGVGRYGSG